MIVPNSAPRRGHLAFSLLAVLCLALLIVPMRGEASAARAAAPPLCKSVGTPKDLPKAQSTTLTTVEQGYRCLLRHYVTGKSLDDRVLLRGAYNGLVSQLRQIGLPLPGAQLPPLLGNRDDDWQVFSQAYTALMNRLPRLAVVQETLAQVALEEMAGALKDDHTAYLPSEAMRPEITQLSDSGAIPTFGVDTSPITSTAPLFITDVFPGSPAAEAGLKPGDTITAIGGQSPFSDGNTGLLHFVIPQMGTSVTLTVRRPANGTVTTVTLHPRNLVLPDTSSRLLAGTIAYVRLYGFTTHAAKEVLDDIKKIGPAVHGVILDLRGNPGGDSDQAAQLVGAFVHHKVLDIQVDGNGKRQAQRTADSVPLLHLPLAVLIDQGSASSSEIVAGAVHDYGLGRLFGERSGGALAGAEFYGLGDGGGLEITEARILGPKSERIDGIGVPPDQHVPTTAAELSAGHDPAVDLAVRYLRAQTAAH